ncbi:hypothetical protein NDU88_003050 [Pleurodeles waltl]|uniref:Uncharacterized protein n=1 Tax=Pleurodeles waltl TaxID=8319 RepID=A0AAV7PAZ8_PLEWA|nr:hypothetical protein NDU88_003050 [Pleurodeles waltl]
MDKRQGLGVGGLFGRCDTQWALCRRARSFFCEVCCWIGGLRLLGGVFISDVVLVFIMEPNKVVQELKVLQDEGREDLLKEGVLEQAWVGVKRPKRVSADGVSAAVAACTSPVKMGKKCKAKSAFGRKLLRSPRSDEEPMPEVFDMSFSSAGRRRGGGRFSRRHGASLARRVAAGGRGSAEAGAVSVSGCMRVRPFLRMRKWLVALNKPDRR